MCNIICVTNRRLCREELPDRLEKIMRAAPYRIILREKDMTESEYLKLAEAALKICGNRLILHSFTDTALRLGCKKIHLPLPILEKTDRKKLEGFEEIGSSVHSREQAVRAEKLGCTYVTAGHVFATDCKKGLAPRGLGFLREVKENVKIPVYGIGGISAENIRSVTDTADGACIMSGFMTADDPQALMEELINEIR